MFGESLPTHLTQILHRTLNSNLRRIRLNGSTSLGYFSQLIININLNKINNLPHLVVFPGGKDINLFSSSLNFFDPTIQVTHLPHFDVSPYDGLYPKSQFIAERLRFLYRAQHAQGGQIFAASIEALLQRTLPYDILAKSSLELRLGMDLPENFTDYLQKIGYSASPIVEDLGQYAQRGGIIDLFSPEYDVPIRLELFGDTIESIRKFNPLTQTSIDKLDRLIIIPVKEVIWPDDSGQDLENIIDQFRSTLVGRNVPANEVEETLRALSRKNQFPGLDFLLPYFYQKLILPIEHFSTPVNLWLVDSQDIQKKSDFLFEELKLGFTSSSKNIVRPSVDSLYSKSFGQAPDGSYEFELNNIESSDLAEDGESKSINYTTYSVNDFANLMRGFTPGSEAWISTLRSKLSQWRESGYRIFISLRGRAQAERTRLFLERAGFSPSILEPEQYSWNDALYLQQDNPAAIHLVVRPLFDSVRIPEDLLLFLREEDLFGKKTSQRPTTTAAAEFTKNAKRLSFGDLKPGDYVVHLLHGIGVYEGLKIMNVGGAESEFIQVAYKDKDKLYLPVYRIGQLNKYAGAGQSIVLDKLGGTAWEKTKTKVRSHLRDIANDLLQLYAKRAELHRPAFQVDKNIMSQFEAKFPFEETEDQIRSILDIERDLASTKPMDRLICGDVGFGKTEVAMRAAFLAVQNKKQVAILAPTTVLTFQHFETFKKRFDGFGAEIRELNRFVSNADVKKTLRELSEGKVDIIIGTHRLLSKDVVFKDLGLLVIDEEQKFGVSHKEKIRKIRSHVDTLSMSATPIPRTLNMSLFGIRDLSLINTAPIDRLPTRTFISKWDDDLIRRAIMNEISRGGQVYFIHNRIQSIYALADEVRRVVPEARIRIGHGQMDEEELEKTMVQFFKHEIDVLICTTIVESGMDVPAANTMFIDQAHMMGLSQLYQLRGRVGRSKQRAYCYLLLPRGKTLEKEAQERLKVIQENTALGSGIRIAQYDLELRGAGDLLGEDQSGHINAVGYELYMDLLNEAIHQLRGEAPTEEVIDPEINLRIPALIPDSYISDIRIRLSYYKALSEIKTSEELDQIESELRDQFGEIPEPTVNLMGLMLIRSQCRRLGVRDLSAGLKNINLLFSEKTRFKPEKVVELTMRENKKYSINPDHRLSIRMNTITWPQVHEELNYLLKIMN